VAGDACLHEHTQKKSRGMNPARMNVFQQMMMIGVSSTGKQVMNHVHDRKYNPPR